MNKAAEVLSASQSGRQKNVILITDEMPSTNGTEEAGNALRAQGATVYAVGVGDCNLGQQELVGIAGGNDRAFVKEIHRFNSEFGSELATAVCHPVPQKKRFW